MNLSVIIPCHNAETTLAAQLQALAGQQWTEPWECIIADNRSTDASREVAKRFQNHVPGLQIVDASEKSGAAYARNLAAQHANGISLAFCDADDVVEDGWVAAMGNALKIHDLVACRVETSKLNPPWLRGHEQETGLQTIWYSPWLPHAGAGTMGCKRKLFSELGGFNESMLFLEDTEFCFQAQKRGFSMHYVANAVVHVRRRANLFAHYRQSRNYAEYNVILARKYRSTGESSLDCHKQFLRDWIEIVRRSRSLCSSKDRFSWAWMLGRQVGRLKGMLRCGGMPV